MAELIAQTPCADLLPIVSGRMKLTEVMVGRLTSIAPYRGRTDALSDAMKAGHNLTFPAPNRTTGRDGERCLWFGKDMALLLGPLPAASLAPHAAITDQSDAWAAIQLEGADAEAVLARLCPLDLRRSHFKRGHTARSLIGHITASITRTGDNTFLILAFRSMASSLVHELETAMKNVAARNSG